MWCTCKLDEYNYMDIDFTLIYDSRTRKYMAEVMSCYEHENYRSAIVMLNSVCLSDLFYKLQELRDVYSDGAAANAISNIEAKINKDKQSASWEKQLVDEIFNNFHLLDSAGYTLLVHLHDYRNLTAHPVLDGSSDLYQPSKELVESCIMEAIANILCKPAIFVKNIVGFMSDDLDSKKGYILDDRIGFENYIEQRYLKHMTIPMIVKVFRSFWKFTFYSDDEHCKKNRKINLALIRFLTRIMPGIVMKDIEDNAASYSLLDTHDTVLMMMIYLSNNPDVYKILQPVVKALIDKRVEDDSYYKLVSWFKSDSKSEHIQTLINQNFVYSPVNENESQYFVRSFKSSGEEDALYKYFIHLVRNATSFTSVMSLIDTYITPNLQNMTPERLEDLIHCYTENNQVYWNYYYDGYCGRAWEYAKAYFTEDYIKERYPKFKIPVIITEPDAEIALTSNE